MTRRGVRVTRCAQRDLVEIGLFTRARWGLLQAQTHLAQLDARFRSLELRPSQGRACSEIRVGYWLFREGSHVIFYRFEEAGPVEIIRVLHERMLLKRHL